MSWLFGGQEDGASDVAGKAGDLLDSFLTIAKSVGEAVKENAEKVADVALSDFQKEQRRFVESKKVGHGGNSLPPWVGYENEEELKDKILALSKDKRNFMRDPPTGQSAFKFSMDKMAACAMATLQEDPSLNKMRTELVPKVLSEDKFWENYFYRVSLIQSSSDVSAMASESISKPNENVPDIEKKGLSAPSPDVKIPNNDDSEIQDVDESTLNEVNDSLQMNDMEEEEELAHQASEPERVNLNDLGGDDNVDQKKESIKQTSEDDAVDESQNTNDTSNKPSDSEGATDSSEKWEKDLDAELEGFSEFETIQDGDGEDDELEEGWEDEVSQMLEEENLDD